MLANQVKVPDAQVPREPVKTNEVKASRDTSSSRNFDRIMQDGRRDQQDYEQRQRENRRQADAKEANAPKGQNVRENDQPERRDHRKEEKVTLRDDDRKPVETANNNEKESKSDSDKIVKEAEVEAKDVSPEPKTELEPKTTEQKLDKAEKSETSQWLDTILSISNSSDSAVEKAQNSNISDKPSVTSEEKVSLLLVQQVLAKNNSDADLSEFEGQQEVSLPQLKSLLSDADYKAILAQVSSENKAPEVTTEQEFEKLLAQLAKGSTEQETTDRPIRTSQSIVDLINQSKQSPSEQQAVAAQVTGESKEADKSVHVGVSNALQSDNSLLDKQDKFKQTSLMNAMQLASEGTGEQDKVEANSSNKPLTDLFAPTTKVVDLGTAPASASEKTQTIGLSSLASQVVNGEAKSNQVGSMELDPQDVKPKESAELKLASLLGQLGGEDIKTPDVTNRTEKVNVAGVTMDKTLQMPKLENISQAKNEVVVRENILFNKQELASQMQTQVGLMMARNMKSVDIRLDPPELGSMQVKLAVQNDQATVSFVVSSQQAKDALENSLPKLKELLEQQGLELADSDVNQQGSQAEANEDEEQGGIASNGLDGDAENDDEGLEQQQQMINRAINSPWNVSYYA